MWCLDGNCVGADHATKRLACLLVRLAGRKLTLGGTLAVANFEEGPVLAGGLRRELRTSDRAEDKLENKGIGGQPAERPAPSTENTCPSVFQLQPLQTLYLACAGFCHAA